MTDVVERAENLLKNELTANGPHLLANINDLVQDLVAEIKRLRTVNENRKASLYAARSIHQQVSEFHRAFGQAIGDKPAVPSDEVVRLRGKLVAEEAFEFLEALMPAFKVAMCKDIVMNLIADAGLRVDLVEAADALADIDYVVEGSRLAFGINGAPIAAEVHRSNMAKLGPDGKPIIGADGKRLKPEGWMPPNIENELRKQGWGG